MIIRNHTTTFRASNMDAFYVLQPIPENNPQNTCMK